MPIPTISYIASGSQAIPGLAALRHGGALPAARRWIVAWCLTGLVFDVIALQFNLRKINNLWLGYISAPTMVVLVLVALSHWHDDPRLRRLLRGLAAGFVATVVVLVLLVEDTSRHSLLRRPLESLLVLLASLGTLLLLVREEQHQLFQRDWFWICCGLTLKYGASIALDPLARLLIGDSREAVSSVLQVRSAINVAAFLIIARGIWCPVLPRPSSGRSSSAH